MNEQQMRRAMREDDIDEDEIDAEIDRWAAPKTRMREELEYMEKQND